nr:uncharacterized protein LOC128682150 isoform X2 [Plodia interpunctella]
MNLQNSVDKCYREFKTCTNTFFLFEPPQFVSYCVNMKRFLYSLVIFNVCGLKINFGEHTKLGILDYGVNWLYNSKTEKTDIRTKFLEEKSENIKSKKRITALESEASNNVEYFNSIPHHKYSKGMKKIKDIEYIENNFKTMVNMEGVKYEYKRDMHWRTWREVTYPNNSRIIVCYRCENIIHTNCEKCHGSGAWAIEDNLPCPYEIFSIISKNEVCAINYKQINRIHEKCPVIIKLSDLRDCNNPMITKYLVKRDYGTASERNRTSLCKEREYCEITTFYQVKFWRKSFDIIKSNNF